MLVLTRAVGQTIVIGDDVRLTITEVERGHIKFMIDAPKHVAVHRDEVWQRIHDTKSGSGD